MQTERLEARASASLFLHPRVGIVVPKHRHKVVARNRVKRRLRELVRTTLLPALGRVDLLIRAKPEAYESTFNELTADVAQIGDWAAGLAR
jgi:ribonuclease P protein component